MRRFKCQTQLPRARLATAFLFCFLLALPSSSKSLSAKATDNVGIFLDAVERQRIFSEKIRNRDKAEIALNFLDEKFPGSEVCYHQGINPLREKQQKTTGKLKIDLNENTEKNSKNSGYIYFITRNRYFIYYMNGGYFINLAYFINVMAKKEYNASQHCIKARDVIMLVDAW